MARWLPIVLLLTSPTLLAQDSSRTAPQWVVDLFLGGGGAERIHVELGPHDEGTTSLASWFNLGADVERRIQGRWSARAVVAYETAGWEGSGGNMFAAPSDQGDRWAVGAGAVYQVYRGARSQFTLHGGARLTTGMEVKAQLQMDTLYTAATFQQATLFYKPAVSGVANITWRWRTARIGPMGLCVTLGAERYHYTYDHADLSSGLSSFPADLLPLTGTNSGWAWTFTIGLFGWK